MSCLKYADCHACSLGKNGQPGKMVKSRGFNDATLAIVGEAPGTMEVVKQRVLFEKTPTGQFVDQMLAACGMRTNKVYFANALLCNYPSGTKPGKRTIDACSKRLDFELKQLTNLKVIIACGNIAIQSLLNKDKITHELYNVYWSERYSAYIIPTYHPAFVLRNIEGFEDVAWAFQTALQFINEKRSGLLLPTSITRRTAKNEKEAIELLNEIAAIDKPTDIAVDCEADDTDWVRTPMLAIGFALDPHNVITVPWISADNVPEVSSDADFYFTPSMVEALARVAANPNLRFCFHNGSYDVKLICQNTGIWFEVHEDTLLLHYNLDERGGSDTLEGVSGGAKVGSHRLKTIARKYLLIPDWEGDIKQFLKSKKSKYSNIPRRRLHDYLGFDVSYCLQLVAVLKQKSLEDDPVSRHGWMHPLEDYTQIKIPAQNEINRIEFDGVRINEKLRRRLSTSMRKRLNELYAEMIKHIRVLEGREGPPPPRITKFGKITKDQPLEFNFNSNKHKQKLIYETLGVELTKDLRTNAKGQVAKAKFPTGRDVLLKIRHVHPIFECMIEFSALTKQHGTYIRPLPVKMDRRGYLHTELLQYTTRTSRWSSRDPNLQNLTKDVKALYVPDEDPNDST